MERTFKNAKKKLAEKEGDKLVKQWEDQKAVGKCRSVVNERCVNTGMLGSFRAGLDSFMGACSWSFTHL